MPARFACQDLKHAVPDAEIQGVGGRPTIPADGRTIEDERDALPSAQLKDRITSCPKPQINWLIKQNST